MDFFLDFSLDLPDFCRQRRDNQDVSRSHLQGDDSKIDEKYAQLVLPCWPSPVFLSRRRSPRPNRRPSRRPSLTLLTEVFSAQTIRSPWLAMRGMGTRSQQEPLAVCGRRPFVQAFPSPLPRALTVRALKILVLGRRLVVGIGLHPGRSMHSVSTQQNTQQGASDGKAGGLAFGAPRRRPPAGGS